MSILKKIYRTQRFFLSKFAFFAPLKLQLIFSHIFASFFVLLEFLIFSSIVLLILLVLFLQTKEGTYWLTQACHEGLQYIKPASIPEFALSVEEFSLENGIQVKNIVLKDAEGVWLEAGNVFVDFSVKNILSLLSKAEIETILLENVALYRTPITQPSDDVSAGFKIPNFVLPLPLGSIEIKDIQVNNFFLSNKVMKLEQYPLDIEANARARALLERGQATIDIEIADKNIDIAGQLIYTPRELSFDLKAEDRIWGKTFPKLDRMEIEAQGLVRTELLPPKKEYPLTVEVKADTKLHDITWLYRKNLNPSLSTEFSFDGENATLINSVVQDEDFNIELPYFSIFIPTKTFARSEGTFTMHDLHYFASVLQGDLNGDFVFYGSVEEMFAEVEANILKASVENENSEFVHLKDAKMRAKAQVLTQNEVNILGDFNLETQAFSLREKKEEFLRVNTDWAVSLQEIKLLNTLVETLDLTLLTPQLAMNIENIQAQVLPLLEGSLQIDMPSLAFLAGQAESNTDIESSLPEAQGHFNILLSKAKKDNKQEVQLSGNMKNIDYVQNSIEDLHIEAMLTDIENILLLKLPYVKGQVVSSGLQIDKESLPEVLRNKLKTDFIYEYLEIAFNTQENGLLIDLKTDGELDFNSRLLVHPQLDDFKLNLEALSLAFAPTAQEISLQKPVALSFVPQIQISECLLELKDAKAKASFSVQASFDATNMILKSSVNLPAQVITPYVDTAFSPHMRLKAEIDIQGLRTNPQGSIKCGIEDFVQGDPKREKLFLSLSGDIANKSLDWTAEIGTRYKTSAGVDMRKAMHALGSLPLLFEPYPFVDVKAPLHAQIDWKDNISTFWSFVPLVGQTLTGNGSFFVEMTGTLEDPAIRGEVYLSKARFSNNLLHYTISDIDLDLKFDQTKAVLKVRASDGSPQLANNKDQGTFLLNATVSQSEESANKGLAQILEKEFYLDMSAAFKAFSPMQRDDLDIRLSGTAFANGLLKSPIIMGSINVDRGVYSLSTSMGTGVQSLDNVLVLESKEEVLEESELEESMQFLFDPIINIQITVPSSFAVRGLGLESLWNGSLVLLGTATSPLLFGTLEPVEGSMELLAKKFSFGNSLLVFSGAPELPIYNISLTRENTAIETIVTVTGIAADMNLAFSSIPSFPTDEIIARTIYGKALADLSNFEAIQVATTATELLSPSLGKLNVLNHTKEALGLQVFRFNTKESTTSDEDAGEFDDVTLEAGGYLSEEIYVGVERGLEDTAVIVEIELLPNVSASGRVGTDSSQAGIIWKKDY